MRRYGEPKDSKQTYLDRPGAYGIILSNQEILLTLQSKPYVELQLPGGGIDLGESPIIALHREVLEETGWRICITRRLGAYQRYTYMPEYNLFARKVCHIYLARAVRKLAEPTEINHTAHWTKPDLAVGHLASEGDVAYLKAYL